MQEQLSRTEMLLGTQAMERLAGDTPLDALPREKLLELWNAAKRSGGNG